MRNELSSYKQLPLNFFQIRGLKFRDEVRPRFGVMYRARILMKDAYSFHTSQESLQKPMTPCTPRIRIFGRMGWISARYRLIPVLIGGNASHEFRVLARGEDDIVFL